MDFTVPFLKYKYLKLKLRVFLGGNTVDMVTYCVAKMWTPCSPVIGEFFDSIIVGSTDKDWLLNDPSKSKSWKVLETVLSHRKPRVSMRLTVNRQMAKKLTVNRQKRNIYTLNHQMSKLIFSREMPQISLIKN